MMLQQEKPEDFVVATGETHSVREFVEASFAYVGKEIVWEGEGLNEVGKEKDTGIVRVKVNTKYFRPTEVVSIYPFRICNRFCIDLISNCLICIICIFKQDFLLGDASKAKKLLGWKPKVSFKVCIHLTAFVNLYGRYATLKFLIFVICRN